MDNYANNYELTLLLGMGFQGAIDALHRHLAAVGYEDLRPVHGFVFERLAPYGATATEIAGFLDISKQAASEIVDYLERHGYVERYTDPQDKRGKIITLTDKGWRCIQEAEEAMSQMEAEWAALLGVGRMEALRADLRTLVQAANGGEIPTKFRPVW